MNDYLDALAEAKGLTSLEYRLVAALRAVEALVERADGKGSAYRDWDIVVPTDDIRTAIRDALEAR